MRVKDVIRDRFLAALQESGCGHADAPLILEKPKIKEHGDICTPIALALAKLLKRNPMQIAESIAAKTDFPSEYVASVDIAKPGFINLRFAQEVLVQNIADIVDRDRSRYGMSDHGAGVRCQIEYVSANPTGPLVIVSARAAAVGAALVNLLRAVGYDAEGEYYVNDFGKQIEALGQSLRFRVKEHLGQVKEGEEPGQYPGEYLRRVAEGVTAEHMARLDKAGGAAAYGKYAADTLLELIKADLSEFGVHFDNFFLESSLHPQHVDAALAMVNEKGYAYEEEGAVYFRTTAFGDDKDRVMVKSDGTPTYFLGDIAYHRTKFERGFEWVIDLLGPDHHGHIPRMEAAAAVLGAPPGWFSALVVGWVRLLEGNKPISMSKRAGDIVPMRDLIEDVGADVAKYFFLMRRSNTPLDFDLDLARKQSDENPVYYVQYAHARIASVVRFSKDKGVVRQGASRSFELLTTPEERELMVHLLFYPYVVEGAALGQEPHRLTVYARELATLFHQFYHQHRIVTDDVDLSTSRLCLAEATQQVLKNTLTLLGVSAPSSM